MRDYNQFDKYLESLDADIYAQPEDEGHTAWARDAIVKLKNFYAISQIKTVLDVGCGQGFAHKLFEDIRVENWTGITRGEDYEVVKKKGLNAHDMDMTFIDFDDNTFDLIFARHVLEHSPFPIITLMEWARVGKRWLYLVAPAPEYWTTKGLNHYSVISNEHIQWLLQRAGWQPVGIQVMTMYSKLFIDHNPKAIVEPIEKPVEFRYICHRNLPVTK